MKKDSHLEGEAGEYEKTLLEEIVRTPVHRSLDPEGMYRDIGMGDRIWSPLFDPGAVV